jgi:beta-lactam-binding protein with PASTA domain
VYVSVPNVIGSGADDASNTIRNAGLSPVRQLVSGGQCSPYAVLETAPAAGTSVVQGSVVQLKVCDPLLMPNLVGMNRDAAIGRLNALGVAYVVQETADSRYTKDEVWSTSPSAGQPILPGVTVTLNVIIHTGGSSGGGDNGGGGDFPDP